MIIDYSTIWKESGIRMDDPFIQAKDLSKLWPKLSLNALKKRFRRIRADCEKQPQQLIHVAEVATCLDVPLQYLVERVQEARAPERRR